MQVLEAYKGQDISSAFRGQGTVAHLHSRGARALLENYCVGTLQGVTAAAPDLPPADLVDESQPLLPQVCVPAFMRACMRACVPVWYYTT